MDPSGADLETRVRGDLRDPRPHRARHEGDAHGRTGAAGLGLQCRIDSVFKRWSKTADPREQKRRARYGPGNEPATLATPAARRLRGPPPGSRTSSRVIFPVHVIEKRRGASTSTRFPCPAHAARRGRGPGSPGHASQHPRAIHPRCPSSGDDRLAARAPDLCRPVGPWKRRPRSGSGPTHRRVVSTVEGVVHPPHDLDVLLRHRLLRSPAASRASASLPKFRHHVVFPSHLDCLPNTSSKGTPPSTP